MSSYDDLIMSLVSEQELVIEYDDSPDSFNPYSFRSSFYRFRKTDIGAMLVGESTFSLALSTEVEPDTGLEAKLCTLRLTPARQLQFKVRSKPNASV
jgi:hypothetical protein